MISLVVSDGLDFSEPDFVTVTVFDILPPMAVATADVTSGPAPLTVQDDVVDDETDKTNAANTDKPYDHVMYRPDFTTEIDDPL